MWIAILLNFIQISPEISKLCLEIPLRSQIKYGCPGIIVTKGNLA
jgi:hypothetical protein